MSEADPDDIYGSDEYEPESPAESPPSSLHSHQSVDRSTALQPSQLDANVADIDDSASESVTPLSHKAIKRSLRESNRVNGRHLLDNTPWTYTVSAFQIRMLRIPIADSRAIRDLRVFATIDKQAAQSQGSKWRHDLQSLREQSSSYKKQVKRSTSLRQMQPYRRSGFIEDAKWVRGDGQLQWTFPMEKFRRLKAYTPRIKAFVYGTREAQTLNPSRTQMGSHLHQEKQDPIVSCGWFFLDLRTMDLPERWMKLQNSPFGGEILIASTFLPVEELPEPTTQPTGNLVLRFEDKVSAVKLPKASTEMKVPAVTSGESGDFLQIGDGNGQDFFVLSVFIQAAFNLSKLVETFMGENRQDLEQTGFWLSYSLFDVVVQTDIFFNLNAAEFSPIRDSFRVKTSVDELKHCLEALGSLTVFLCTENQVLAGVNIPFTLLLSKGLFADPEVVENKSEVGDASDLDGKFSFPDFDDAFISASVAVELVETNTMTDEPQDSRLQSKADEKTGGDEQDQILMKIGDDAISCEHPADLVLFKLEYLRLKISALSPFTGKENVCIEVAINEEKAAGVLAFCSSTNQYAFATCPTLNVIVDNPFRPNALDTAIRLRCYSSVSNTLVAESSKAANRIDDDTGYPRLIVFSLQNNSNHIVGQCTISCSRGPEAQLKASHDNSCDLSDDTRLYRLCLKLKSIRDLHIPGGYALRYQHPFLQSARVTSDWFTVDDTSRMDTIDFYCTFDLVKNPLKLKRAMQEPVNIDLISSDDDIVGSAVFSLSYLYFSEEHFCCSLEHCHEVFLTQSEAEAHWLDVHADSALPDTETGSEAYSHSYRSCSINIPIVSADTRGGLTDQSSQRRGSIRVSAYLEDTGQLTEKRIFAQKAGLALPQFLLQESECIQQETQGEPRQEEASSIKPKQDRVVAAEVLHEVKEPIPTMVTRKESSTDENAVEKADLTTREVKLHERENKIAELQTLLEREKRAWKHEQHLQQLQWKRRFAEMEKSRMDELEEEWACREEERSNLLKSAQEEYQQLEQTLRKSLIDFETRERRLAVAEAALQREQEAKRDENESFQRRLKNEHSHTLALTKKQTEAYERRIELLESQLRETEHRAKQVEADFAEYRQQQRKLPESKLREEIAALRGNVSELEKQKLLKAHECEAAKASVEKMKAQLDQMAGLLTREKKKHEARVVDELEKLRVKYIAREEKYVLDGDRDELRAIKKQLDDLKGFKVRSTCGKKRSHRQRSHEPASLGNPWHTPNRQTALVHQLRSASESDYSFQSDRANRSKSNEETSSYVQSRRPSTSSQLETQKRQSLQDEASSCSNVINHKSSVTANKVVDHVDVDNPEDYIAHSGTELGRLLRERKLLLASGAYDTQSYLVRELDRLIHVTKANSEYSG